METIKPGVGLFQAAGQAEYKANEIFRAIQSMSANTGVDDAVIFNRLVDDKILHGDLHQRVLSLMRNRY